MAEVYEKPVFQVKDTLTLTLTLTLALTLALALTPTLTRLPGQGPARDEG